MTPWEQLLNSRPDLRSPHRGDTWSGWSRGHTLTPLASWLIVLGAAMVAGGIWWGLSC